MEVSRPKSPKRRSRQADGDLKEKSETRDTGGLLIGKMIHSHTTWSRCAIWRQRTPNELR